MPRPHCQKMCAGPLLIQSMIKGMPLSGPQVLEAMRRSVETYLQEQPKEPEFFFGVQVITDPGLPEDFMGISYRLSTAQVAELEGQFYKQWMSAIAARHCKTPALGEGS
jgi:hypothetical protein